jgi:hypothetical protein
VEGNVALKPRGNWKAKAEINLDEVEKREHPRTIAIRKIGRMDADEWVITATRRVDMPDPTDRIADRESR